MAGYVHFYKKGAAEYGEWRVSVRDGDKVTHERRNLGRVIDKERMIFKKRDGLVYGIDEDGNPREVALNEVQKPLDRESLEWGDERGPLDFGDVFLTVEYVRQMGLPQMVGELLDGEGDTVKSLLVYKIVATNSALMHCAMWWKGSYACYLFPEADLRSQAIKIHA